MSPRRVQVPKTTQSDDVLDELLGGAGSPPADDKSPRAAGRRPAAEAEAKSRPRLTVYVDADVQEQLRDVVHWTNNREGGFSSVSDLVEAGCAEIIARLRHDLNDDQPFPRRPAGAEVRRGRPVRGSG